MTNTLHFALTATVSPPAEPESHERRSATGSMNKTFAANTHHNQGDTSCFDKYLLP
ncbi:hypothetical protein [Actimicrobium antarcticum]|uniref:hypothetical protein n=1 Tax=Actimicrobium antarcticum TaxID=1051899 RepID=UPI0031D80461